MNKLIFLAIPLLLLAAVPNVYPSDNEMWCDGKNHNYEGISDLPELDEGKCYGTCEDKGGDIGLVCDIHDSKCKFGEGYCSPGSCYARGLEDGKNNDFGDYFKIDPSRDCDAGEFLPRYTEGFLDGCISVGNTRETCEDFTDD